MRLDALYNSHPIQVEVHHPDEIGEVFDMISYAKGAAVLRQLQVYLGHDVFRDGLRHYLKKHSYKNTETKHLWESLEKVSKKKVGALMHSWIMKMGYPLVKIDRSRDGYTATQERFLSSRISAKKSKDKTLWQIPLSYTSDEKRLTILGTKKKFALPGSSIGKVNIGETSFVRVRYDRETLEKLREQVEKGTLQTIDRMAIIRDLFALAEGGYVKTSDALEFSRAYQNETEYIVWAEISAGVNKIYNLIKEEECKEKYQAYALSLFSPLAERLGWEESSGEAPSYTFLRNIALSQAGTYGDKRVASQAKKLWRERKKSPIRANIRSIVYAILVENGGEKEWGQMRKLYEQEEMHEEKNRYAFALTRTRSKTLLAKTLMFILSPLVRDQDAPQLLVSTWANMQGRELTWQFVQHNWGVMLKRYGEGGHFLSRLLSPLGLHTNIKDIVDIKKFFAKNAAPGTARTLEQSYERIASNAAWIKDDKKDIENWLKNR
jgi:aminopeptidase N